MFDFFFEAVRPANLLFTAMMGLITLYWLLVAFGALDFESEPSLDAGHAGDLHVDTHVEGGQAVDVSHDAGAGLIGAFKSVLQFLNFGDVPSMVVVSIMVLSSWTFSMVGNHYFNEGFSMLRALVLLVPNLLLTAIITKVLTAPLKKLFNSLNREYEQHKPVVGRTCTITTSEVTDRFGQAQIDTSGAPLLINVRTYGDSVFARGESALIIKEDKENNLYTVAKLTSTNPQPTITPIQEI